MQLRLYVTRCRPTVKDGTVNAAKPRDSVKKNPAVLTVGVLSKRERRKNMEIMSLERTTYVTTRYDGFHAQTSDR